MDHAKGGLMTNDEKQEVIKLVLVCTLMIIAPAMYLAFCVHVLLGIAWFFVGSWLVMGLYVRGVL